jgi:hypothetical protein
MNAKKSSVQPLKLADLEGYVPAINEVIRLCGALRKSRPEPDSAAGLIHTVRCSDVPPSQEQLDAFAALENYLLSLDLPTLKAIEGLMYAFRNNPWRKRGSVSWALGHATASKNRELLARHIAEKSNLLGEYLTRSCKIIGLTLDEKDAL